jgi:hypothetical protein
VEHPETEYENIEQPEADSPEDECEDIEQPEVESPEEEYQGHEDVSGNIAQKRAIKF